MLFLLEFFIQTEAISSRFPGVRAYMARFTVVLGQSETRNRQFTKSSLVLIIFFYELYGDMEENIWNVW